MSNLSLMRRLALSFKAVAPGSGRQLAGRDFEGNLYFEKPDPNGGRYPRRTVELADPKLSEANYDDANISVQWQAWLRNTRKDPPTQAEIQRDEARKLLTVTRAKALDQAWQDRKAELALEQAQGRQAILGLAASASKGGAHVGETTTTTTTTAATAAATKDAAPYEDEDPAKSAARKQVEEREASRKDRAAGGTPVGPSLQSLNDLKMAETLLKEGRLLGVKAFAIATTMCISGAVLIVGGTRWALDVETIPEFSAKMRELFPKQKSKFVDAVVGADRSVFGDQRQQQESLSESRGGSTDGDEKDLDHEEDYNILGRIERELRRLENEDKESQSAIAQATIDP
ncbi:hypothetical protein EC991_006754 [Linnemannia zychae]|nr:hypothetical protein EC991_006754 [Linnemannia zychae]